MSRRRRLFLRAESIAVLLGLLAVAGLAAWASATWHWRADWTHGNRNSLSSASRQVLQRLSQPVTISAYVRPGSDLADYERRLLERYRRADPGIRLRFVNPDVALEELRARGIDTAGEIYVRYGKRGEKVSQPRESDITNALLRLARDREARVVFLTGHGEAKPDGHRNFDLGNFAAALKRQGFEIGIRNLARDPSLGKDTALVVVAGPQQDFLPGEVSALEHWIGNGGNLLWLRNPGPLHALGPVAAALGVTPLRGVIADTTSRSLGIDDATTLVLSEYGNSPVTRNFALTTLFPHATGFTLAARRGDWKPAVFLRSRHFPSSWMIAPGTPAGEVVYRPGTDTPGPIDIGIALQRPLPSGDGSQRAAVVGDTDFLSDSYLGNGGNLGLGLRLVNWLTGQGRFVDVSAPQAPDRNLELSAVEQGVIGLGFLAGLPILFLGIAFAVWFRRRRR